MDVALPCAPVYVAPVCFSYEPLRCRAACDRSMCSTLFAALVTRKPQTAVGFAHWGHFNFIWHLCTMVDRVGTMSGLCSCQAVRFFCGSAPGL